MSKKSKGVSLKYAAMALATIVPAELRPGDVLLNRKRKYSSDVKPRDTVYEVLAVRHFRSDGGPSDQYLLHPARIVARVRHRDGGEGDREWIGSVCTEHLNDVLQASQPAE